MDCRAGQECRQGGVSAWTQVRNDFDQGSSHKDGENWMNSGYILNLEWTGPADEVDVENKEGDLGSTQVGGQ